MKHARQVVTGIFASLALGLTVSAHAHPGAAAGMGPEAVAASGPQQQAQAALRSEEPQEDESSISSVSPCPLSPCPLHYTSDSRLVLSPTFSCLTPALSRIVRSRFDIGVPSGYIR